ncbi:prepilin-type N-terminal cleavage/methylation domain-containing protein [Acinetobacter halotolerans]|uniref:Prepilin-type N-terminal cleavage/methylation domain-containing protein n=1 Tax=Acinetobacter halotolerans TaxID=1752076 RepID=A0A4Q6XE39_9GAMM|nr:prepilin-type N-terminal cleavage/methylation domain-containing protein [Acinetobacter halotolerans]
MEKSLSNLKKNCTHRCLGHNPPSYIQAKPRFINAHSGFTLIELMLSLALGLIITAAAILLFLTGQRSLSMQQGVSDIQDNANFGLNYITQDIRLTNLNNSKAIINDETAAAGIVLTSSVNATLDETTTPATPLSNLRRSITGTTANVNLLSRSSGMTVGAAPMWTGVSNVTIDGEETESDQLVIQYTPQYTTTREGTVDYLVGGFDCEGNALKFLLEQDTANPARPFGRQVVVQRYFLREDNNRQTNEPNQALALACDAGYYPVDGSPVSITNYGDAGEIIMKRVDHFRVLLNVQSDVAEGRRYISINDYLNLAAPRPRIVSVQLGMLVRSAQSVGTDSAIKNDQEFMVLDQAIKVKVPENTNTKYVRQIVSQTIALRNVFGERGQ